MNPIGSALTRGTFAVIASIVLAATASADDVANGQALFDTCAACHGVNGGGMTLANAPAIAGLPQWYVESQLDKFQTGARGAHPDDVEGLKMRPMSRYLMTGDDGAEKLKDVAAYVASMPVVETESLVHGDADKGKVLYTPCIACHGVDGGGSQPLNGPPLRGQSDWYLESSIHKFRSGVRGANPLDTTGALMRPMSMTLPDEQAIKDVIAYIRTLGN